MRYRQEPVVRHTLQWECRDSENARDVNLDLHQINNLFLHLPSIKMKLIRKYLKPELRIFQKKAWRVLLSNIHASAFFANMESLLITKM